MAGFTIFSYLLCSTKEPVAKAAGFFVQQAVLTPALRAAPSQPENHGAGQCGSGATGRHIGMLCEPNSSGGASRSATGVLRMRVKMLCKFQVSSFPGAGGVFGVGPAPTATERDYQLTMAPPGPQRPRSVCDGCERSLAEAPVPIHIPHHYPPAPISSASFRAWA